jgi:aldehyde dehydrogenase (NAD+)
MAQTLVAPPTTPTIRQTRLLINNEWVDASDGHTSEGKAAEIDRAVKAARRALEHGPWAEMDAADRGRLLYDLAVLVEKNAEELATLESFNCGKTITDSRGDIVGVANTLRYYAGWADKVEGRTVPVRGNFLSYTLRQPVGVVGQIIPWNFPLLMLAWKWGPALACGNTIVMKPAEQTPLTALRIGELAIEAGFPAGVINLVNGFGETAGAALVAHPDVDKIAFTGHVDTAKIIQRQAAETLKRVTFELGGKSPNVVFADADLDNAVAGAFHAIYFHGGQCCTAGSRLFVEKKVHKEFVERLSEKAKARNLGDPLDPSTEQGPQVSAEQLDKILHYVQLGKKEGATLVSGGQRHGDRGFYVEPTIFDKVSDGMAIARDEIFGPVVSILPFDGVDEVVDRANRTNYGLAAAVWTKDIDKAHLYARRVKAGTVWVNCYHVVDTTTPFGGFKMSGQGRENGEAALEHYTELKTVTVKLG